MKSIHCYRMIVAIPAIVTLVFGWVLALDVLGAVMAKQADSWIRVSGRVLKVENVFYEARRHSYSKLSCRYSYVVDDVPYEGTRISPASLSTKESDEIVCRLKEGGPVEVLVNPRDHSYSILSQKVSASAFLIPVIGFSAGLCAIAFMIIQRKSLLRILEISMGEREV